MLKTESLHHDRFATCEQAKQVVFEYIEVFYNCIWRYAKVGDQLPSEFANRCYCYRSTNQMTCLPTISDSIVAEGLDLKITDVQKRAYGFWNGDHFKIATYFHCGGLGLYPAQ